MEASLATRHGSFRGLALGTRLLDWNPAHARCELIRALDQMSSPLSPLTMLARELRRRTAVPLATLRLRLRLLSSSAARRNVIDELEQRGMIQDLTRYVAATLPG